MSKLFDGGYLVTVIPKIMKALPTTLFMLLMVMFIGLIVGALLAFMRIKGGKIVSGIAALYVSFARGTPELVQLFLIYYMLPDILKKIGINVDGWSKMTFAIIAFSLSNAAFLSETLRAAYLSVPKGQHEAAASIGMTGWQSFRRIIFPQTMAVAIPNISNSVAMVFKTLSIGFSIGVVEILGKTKLISAAGYGAHNLECYVAAAIIYCVVYLILERGSALIEKIFSKGKKQYT